MKRTIAVALAAAFLLTGCSFNPGALFSQKDDTKSTLKAGKDKTDKQDLTPEQRQERREQRESKGKGK